MSVFAILKIPYWLLSVFVEELPHSRSLKNVSPSRHNRHPKLQISSHHIRIKKLAFVEKRSKLSHSQVIPEA